MEKEFVPYELALKLKELGFDERCFASYYTDVEKNKTEKYDVRKKLNASFDWNPFTDEEDSGYILNSDKEYYVSAPLWQQAFDWFREKHDLYLWIHKYKEDYGYGDGTGEIHKCFHRSYEEAKLECLKKLIEIVKMNNNHG